MALIYRAFHWVEKLKLQKNLDKTKQVIANISKLDNVQDKLILLLVCILGRIQHLLGAAPINLSRHFAHEHDKAITTAVADADALDLGPLTKHDKLIIQRKLSNHGLGLRSIEANLEFLFLAGFMKTVKSITSAFPHFNPTLASTLTENQGMGSSWQRHSILLSELIVKQYWIY